MGKAASLALVVLFVLSAFLVASSSPAAAAPTGCTHTYSAPPAQQWTISSQGVYCLKAGTYDAQISITSSNVVLTAAPGTKAGQVIIEPSSVVVNNYVLLGIVFPQAAIILAGSSGGTSNLRGVSITNLVIDGSLASPSLDNYPACYADYAGINYNGASGSILNNVVANMYLPPDQAGCGGGGGINGIPGTDVGPTETITIANNVVPNYNEYGIACGDARVDCTIYHNAVSFYAAYASMAFGPAGITIQNGAVGAILDNSATGNECSTPVYCGPDYITQYQGDGILTYFSGAATFVIGNSVSNNGVGISSEGTVAAIAGNDVVGSEWEGMLLFDGDFTPIINEILGGAIAIVVGSDGFVDSPTVGHLSLNGLGGTFSQAIVEAVAYTGEYAFGGPYVEAATATIDGLSMTVSPGPSGTPTYADITSLP